MLVVFLQQDQTEILELKTTSTVKDVSANSFLDICVSLFLARFESLHELWQPL